MRPTISFVRHTIFDSTYKFRKPARLYWMAGRGELLTMSKHSSEYLNECRLWRTV